ncbi:MAG: hypothetical protein J0I06_28525, partial [Planctomycetes bacterium]|nr:hypothetical protein [Planctomycetota bacterium]
MPEDPTPQPPPPEGEGEQESENPRTQTGSDGFSPPLPPGEGAGGWGSSRELLSLVIPVYNERESLVALHAEI